METTSTRKLAIFASGAGSNAQRILEHFDQQAAVEVGLVVSDQAKAGVLAIARKWNCPSYVLSRKGWQDCRALLGVLQVHQIDFIALAGFLKRIPPPLVHAFPQKMVNVHPALLPHFGGKGMYGKHVHQAVKQAGVSETGISIHWVNENYDEGALLLQKKCMVHKQDSPEDIAQKVQRLEHEYYPQVLERLLLNKSLEAIL